MAGHTLHLQYIIGQQDIVVLVLIVGIVAAHDEGCAGFEALPLRHIFVFIAEDFEVDGTVIVGDGGKVDFAAVALYLGKNTSPHTVTLPPSPRSFSGRRSAGLKDLP